MGWWMGWISTEIARELLQEKKMVRIYKDTHSGEHVIQTSCLAVIENKAQ